MATQVSKIKGVSPETSAKLKEQGITNTDQLLEAGMTASARRDLAKKTGIESKTLLEFVNRADLAAHQGHWRCVREFTGGGGS